MAYFPEIRFLELALDYASLALISLTLEPAAGAEYMNPYLPGAHFSRRSIIAHGSTGKFQRLAWDGRPLPERASVEAEGGQRFLTR